MQQLTDLVQYSNQGLFILRLAVGAVFIIHGWPKIKNFKAAGLAMGLPATFVLIIGLVEVLSAMGLILGIYNQIAALLIGLVMLGAIKMKLINWKTGFVAKAGMGWEYDLVLLAAAIVILLTGGGNIGLIK